MTEVVYNQLDVITDLAMTLMGFIAVFLVLSNKDGRFTGLDRNFIQTIVLVSSVTIVLGLVPRPLSLFVGEQMVWKVSLLIGLTGGILVTVLMARFQMTMDRVEASKVHFGWHVGAWGGGICSMVSFLVGTLGYFSASSLYLTGVVFMILDCVWCFIAIVFRRFF